MTAWALATFMLGGYLGWRLGVQDMTRRTVTLRNTMVNGACVKVELNGEVAWEKDDDHHEE